MIFRQFCTSDDQISYLLADPVTRYTALLDPHRLAEDAYREVIRRLDLRLVYLVETHAHESHTSAAPLLKAGTGAQLVTHSRADIDCVDLHVDDDESLFVGEEVVRVIATPGHSPCSLCFTWRDRVFTGHTLLAGVTGTCHRPDADAGQLFDSIQERLYDLPDETLVYPGRQHGQRRLTSIGQEKQSNEDLTLTTSRAQFIRRKQTRDELGSSGRENELATRKVCGGR